jgi:hypothetical protein
MDLEEGYERKVHRMRRKIASMTRGTEFLWKDDYVTILEKWFAVVAQPLSDTEKEQVCFSILQEYVGRMALACARTSNPSLRFWTYMYVLKGQLSPGPGSHDQFGKSALRPAARWVYDWIESNRQGKP